MIIPANCAEYDYAYGVRLWSPQKISIFILKRMEMLIFPRFVVIYWRRSRHLFAAQPSRGNIKSYFIEFPYVSRRVPSVNFAGFFVKW